MSNEMTIALSASYFETPIVHSLLDTCDLIYTTNVNRRDDLFRIYGVDRVKFIPDCSAEMLEFLKERHHGAKFIHYNDIFKLRYPKIKDVIIR